MRWVFVGVLILHGLIHLLGFAKSFGLMRIEQLTQPISHALGIGWLLGGLLLCGAALAFALDARWFWLIGAVAVVLSQVLIFGAWSDAKFGTVANGVALVGVILGFASRGPVSFRAAYEREVRAQLGTSYERHVVTEADLAGLPEPVQQYVRLTGSVGQPQVSSLRATWRGRIRGSATEPWMVFRAEQHNFYAAPPTRFFLMNATMKGLPVDVFHRFVADSATFGVRLLSIFPLVDAKGPELTRAETVTLFNDLCVLAPSRLIEPSIRWEAAGAHTARAHYTRGRESITALLEFNEEGELVDFSSDDRQRASADGKSFLQQRWTTPLRVYRSFGVRRVASIGEARWDDPSGSFAYGEFELLDLEYAAGTATPR